MTQTRTVYRLSWETPGHWTAQELDARFGRDLTGKLTDKEWDDLDWQPPTVNITDDPWDQYHTLKRWAETRRQPIRNVKLERREEVAPDDGWEPVT